MKKQILKLLLALSIVAFAITITAASCGKTAGNNSGGGGYKRPALIADAGEIKITNVDANLVKITGGTNILLKLSAFPTQAIPDIVDEVINAVVVYNDRTKKAFEIVNDKASEGMVIVAKGNVASAETITTPAVADVTTRSDRSYPFTANYGIYVVSAATADGGMPAGLSFFGSFHGGGHPTNTNQVAPDVEPFDFSGISGSFARLKPSFWCIATVPTAASTDKLTGGHRASCFVAAFGGVPYGGTDTAAVNNRTAWLGTAQPFKREFQFAVSAIRTDGWTIGDLLGDGTAPAKSTAFSDGLTAAEMKKITESNSKPVPFKKFNIKIVNEADFAAAP